MHKDILDRQVSLQRLFNQAVALQSNDQIDFEVRFAFESYLCVRTYAHLETSVRTILLQYVRSVSSSESVERFIEFQFKRLPSLSYSELIKLIGRFNRDWTEKIKAGVTIRMRETMDSLVNIRNSIAHGGNTIFTLPDLQNYFASIQEIIRIVFDACTSDFASART